jgi:hypothetical protein
MDLHLYISLLGPSLHYHDLDVAKKREPAALHPVVGAAAFVSGPAERFFELGFNLSL